MPWVVTSAGKPWVVCVGVKMITSFTMSLISCSVQNVKPCSIAVLKVPPGGSSLGRVQYTPLSPFRS